VLRGLLVVNPKATSTSPRTRDVLVQALGAELKLDVRETQGRGHATLLAGQARDDEVDVVIALGGDGTVNEVVNGLLTHGPGPGVPDLAVVPGGSTNVFARAVGLPDDQVEATGQLLEGVREGRRRALGLGTADGRWFTFTAGLGLDAEVVAAVERHRAEGRRSTKRLYLRSAVEQYFRHTERRNPPMSLRLPGAETEALSDVFLVIVGNTSPWTYLGRLRVDPFPGASFDRGLDVLAVQKLAVPTTLWTAGQLLTPNGRPPWGGDATHMHDLPGFSVTADRPVAFQVDGDYLGERVSVEFRAVPDALQVVV
jgi:diacylglycerol kinase family enzyme